jgi:hypothetical protein
VPAFSAHLLYAGLSGLCLRRVPPKTCAHIERTHTHTYTHTLHANECKHKYKDTHLWTPAHTLKCTHMHGAHAKCHFLTLHAFQRGREGKHPVLCQGCIDQQGRQTNVHPGASVHLCCPCVRLFPCVHTFWCVRVSEHLLYVCVLVCVLYFSPIHVPRLYLLTHLPRRRVLTVRPGT